MPPTSTVIQRLLPGCEIRAVDRLQSSERTVVDRVCLVRPEDDAPEQVILKQFVQTAGFATEAGALSVLPAGAPVPQLLAEDPIGRVIVMTDVGSGPSLADALLGDSTEVAEAALSAWAETMAQIYRATSMLARPFRSTVVERGGNEEQVEPMARWLVTTPSILDNSGLAVPSELQEQLTAMTAILADPAWGVVSQGGACPDNNIITPAGLHLVDFEEAAFRHLAWDLAYLRVPWPSCWCAWDLPPASAEAVTPTTLEPSATPRPVPAQQPLKTP